jgi:hypothetical protein
LCNGPGRWVTRRRGSHKRSSRLQRLPVADQPDVSAKELRLLLRPLSPTACRIEVPSAPILIQHPENRVAEAALAQSILGGCEELAADASSPRAWLNVERAQLSEAFGPIFRRSTNGGEANDCAVLISNDDGFAGSDCVEPRGGALRYRQPPECFGGKGPRVGSLPASNVDLGDAVRIRLASSSNHSTSLRRPARSQRRLLPTCPDLYWLSPSRFLRLRRRPSASAPTL